MAVSRVGSKRKSARRRLVPGDRATIRFGGSTVSVEVVEDRGNVGYRGDHIMRVRVIDGGMSEPRTFEVRADNLTPARSRRNHRAPAAAR